MKGTIRLFIGTAMLSLGMMACGESTPTTSPNSAAFKASNNEQSAMIALDGDATFNIVENSVYQFDRDAAASYFSGGTDEQRKNVAQSQRCTFWNGGTLVAETVGGGKNAVTITPIAPGTVSAQTSWTLVSSESSTVDITFDGRVLGQSWMANKQFPAPKGKYSFTLTNSDNISRVQNLRYTLDNGASYVAITNSVLGHEDNPYYQRTSGSTSLLNGYVADILAGDAHTGNDLDGADVETFSIDLTALDAGSYTLRVDGVVKGATSTSQDMSFSVSRSITIDAGNCQ